MTLIKVNEYEGNVLVTLHLVPPSHDEYRYAGQLSVFKSWESPNSEFLDDEEEDPEQYEVCRVRFHLDLEQHLPAARELFGDKFIDDLHALRGGPELKLVEISDETHAEITKRLFACFASA